MVSKPRAVEGELLVPGIRMCVRRSWRCCVVKRAAAEANSCKCSRVLRLATSERHIIFVKANVFLDERQARIWSKIDPLLLNRDLLIQTNTSSLSDAF